LFQHYHASCDARGLSRIVGDDDAGQMALPDDVLNQRLDFELGGFIERRGRLVEQQHDWGIGEGACQ
jgi:hypothetical protein